MSHETATNHANTFLELASKVMDGSLNRRQAMQKGAALGLSVPAMMALGAVGNRPKAAAGQEASPEPVRGGTLRVGLSADPAELDPHKTNLTAAWHVIEHVYEGLLSTNAALEPVPALAESWEISEDGLTYTFNLRQGVMFHPPVSREFVAEDVKYSFERILDPETASPATDDLSGVESIEIPDDYTVVMTMKAPDASFLAKLMGNSLKVVPRETVEENGDLMQVMVGTGPFVFEEYVPNSMVSLTANPEYWEEGKPYVDAMEMQIIPDATSRSTALTSGTVDFIEYAPAQDLPIYEADDTIVVTGDENTNIRYMDINVSREPFNIPEVRKAIAMVIDRQPIIDSAVFGAGTATNILFPATFWAGFESEIPEPDIEGAKALLAEAGYPDGFTTELHSWAQYPFLSNAAIVIQEQLKQIGIEADTRFEENAIYLENYFAGNFDLSVTGTSAYVDPNDVVEPSFVTGGTRNGTGYSNPEMDELVQQGKEATDQEERAQIYRRIQEIILEDVNWVNLFIASQYEAMKDYVKGYVHIATGSNVSFKETWLDQ
ncbi:MAG TPA: ABC transporter substrate-binding protein [Thermomicrobiales bacterium]|jgi:peptide/nickel transport system substrate-binding protein|nr:ABC transporter substrate-binding protein [Thermomicrobiales bacterium]